MKRSQIAFLAGVVALGACHRPRTEIILTIDSNLSFPAELDQVHVIVASEKSATRFDQMYNLGTGQTKLPIVLGLVPDTDKNLAFRAVAQGLKGGVVVVERSAVTSFVPDQTLALFLDLLRVCVQATCPVNQTCGPDGVCIAETVTPTDLPKYGTTRDAALGVSPDGGGQGGDGGTPVRTDAADASSDLHRDQAHVGDSPGDFAPADTVADARMDTSPSLDMVVDIRTPDLPFTAGEVPPANASDASTDIVNGPDAPTTSGPFRVVGQFGATGKSSGATYTVIGNFVWAGGTTAGKTWSVGPP